MIDDRADGLRAAIVRWRDATREWDIAKFGGYGHEEISRRNRAAEELADATAALSDIADGGPP